MIKDAIAKLVERKSLTTKEAEACFDEILRGEATPAQIGAFATALRMKGETAEEIAAGVRSMQRCMSAIKPRIKGALSGKAQSGRASGMLLDTCGTGGDKLSTFNISTTAAFVAAGAGCSVAKHGNRAFSSKAGSADVLEALGVNLNAEPKKVERIIEQVGIGFLFAPLCHGAMKHASPVRREIGIRTVFNILGPIVNPANAQARLLGVYDENLAEKVAKALQMLKVKRALVVHGLDGMDELSTTAKTLVYEIKEGKIRKYFVKPEDFGMKKAKPAELEGGDSQKNAEILKAVLSVNASRAQTEIVLLNAGAAIYVCGNAKGIKEGIAKARDAIASGKALGKLHALIEQSREAAEYSDVVDEKNRVVGKATRDEVHEKKLNHRSVGVFLVGKDGRLLITRRSGSKVLRPGEYDLSAYGHVLSGESYEAAARRELKEELNLELPLKRFGGCEIETKHGTEFLELYTAQYSGKVEFNRQEIGEAFFTSAGEIAKKLNDSNSTRALRRALELYIKGHNK